jgi:hypothetical protein
MGARAMKAKIAIQGGLDEEDAGTIILRGALEQNTLINLQTDWYQRGANFNPSKIRKMVSDIEAGQLPRFPDITLGMRGHKWSSEGDRFALHDPVYIIDGLQRWTAANVVLEKNPNFPVRMGCKLYFNTDVTFEREMFRELNTKRTSVAPSVILRNEKDSKTPAGYLAATLYGMTITDKDFALVNRVCWDQTPIRSGGETSQIIRGSSLLYLLMDLHKHKIHAIKSGGILNTLNEVGAKIDTVGSLQARKNLVYFFDIVDKVWGVRGVTYPAKKIHLSQNWLSTLAMVFSNHSVFWKDDDTVLHIPAAYIKDLEKIDPQDDELARLVRSVTNNGREILYDLFIRRFNKGKTNRLKDRVTEENE